MIEILLIIITMLVMSLFGTKQLSSVLSRSSGFDVDSFRTISLVIAILRLANEMYDLIWKPKIMIALNPAASSTYIPVMQPPPTNDVPSV
jgi:hypothetical protein